MLKTLLIPFLLLAAPAVPAPCGAPAFCRCAPGTPEGYARGADAIFTATVVEVRENEGKDRVGHVARMRVEAAWKGVEAAEAFVAGGATSCDFFFEAGQRFLVYGRMGPDGMLHATYCSGSRLEPGAAETGPLGAPARTWTEPAAG